MTSLGLPPYRPCRNDALLIVDLQIDFMPGGALGVAGADQLIGPITELAKRFPHVVASRDTHPVTHKSFKENGGPWPAHCVTSSAGAAFAPGLALPATAWRLTKGAHPERECLSAFRDESGASTGLAEWLRRKQIDRVFLCGVALDVCVMESALDSVRAGFETGLFPALCASIGDPAPSLERLAAASVKFYGS